MIIFSHRIVDIHHLVVGIGLCLLVTWFGFNLYYGERTFAGDGIAWDASGYAQMSKTNPAEFFKGSLGQYRFQRILPATIVYYLSQIFCLPMENNQQIIFAWYLYLLGILAIAFLFFWLIAKHFEWSLPVRIMAFSALFLNYPVLKQSVYNVPLTDISAMVLGIVMFYFFLKRNSIGIIITTLLGSFTYPTFIYIGIPLLIFPACWQKRSDQRTILDYLLMPIVMINITFLVFHSLNADFYLCCQANQLDSSPLLFTLSLVSLCFYFHFITKPLMDIKFLFSTFRSQLSLWGVILGVSLYLTIKTIISSYGGPASPITAYTYLQSLGIISVVNPLVFLVAHVAYFGPAVLILMFLWKDTIALVKKEYGLGLISVIALFVLLSIDSESRRLINGWPLFALVLCQVINKHYSVTYYFAYTFCVSSLVISKFWFKINVGTFGGNLIDFPQQRYFMNYGPWLSDEVYYVYAAIAILMAPLFYCLLKQLPKRDGKRG